MFARWWRLFRLLFGVPIAARLWTLVGLMALYSGFVVAIEYSMPTPFKIGVHPQMHTVLGVFLGMLLAFRNNTAYDRWWEGRKLWGQLVNDSRNLVLKATALAKVEAVEVQYLSRLLVNFARGLKEHLREGIKPRQLSIYKQVVPHEPKHVPLNLALLVRQKISQWRSAGKIDGLEEMQLDLHSRALMDICGACERIRNTPLSSSYRALLRHGIAIYLAVAPFYLMEDTGIAGLPMFILAAYFLLGVEFVAEEIEEPFGAGGDNLPLERYCATISQSVNEIIAPTDGSSMADPSKTGPGDSSARDLE
jgi:ion channel-forming bestrophin family protein